MILIPTSDNYISLYLIECAVVGSWLTNEECGGEWTIDADGKTTLDNEDYGPKYYIKEDPTGVLRRGDGWVSGPESTANRLVWTFKGEYGVTLLALVVWTRRHRLELHQGAYTLFRWRRYSIKFNTMHSFYFSFSLLPNLQ